jgi:Uma2 family endonuclease
VNSTGVRPAHQSDGALVARERLPAELPDGCFPGPPDLAVGVISPNDRAPEVLAKVVHCLDAGCREVSAGDPRTQTLKIQSLGDTPHVLACAETLTSRLLPGSRLNSPRYSRGRGNDQADRAAANQPTMNIQRCRGLRSSV